MKQFQLTLTKSFLKSQTLQISAINSHFSTSVAGNTKIVSQFAKYLQKSESRFSVRELPISIAAHCKLMEEAAKEYADQFNISSNSHLSK